jgi:serine/threonine-protein kinase HipA
LISAGDEVRLAPLYDLSSQLPYPDLIEQRVAMKIGDHYEIPRVSAEDWQKLARQCQLNESDVMGTLVNLAVALPDAIADASKQALADGLAKNIVVPLAKQLTEHAKQRLASVRS